MALAEIGAPIGLQGAVRIHTLKSVTGLPIEDSLLVELPDCWIRLAGRQDRWLHSSILSCTPQTRGLKLQLNNITDRNQAETLRGAAVGISRSRFPELPQDEAYWVDLMGCEVINRQGHSFGAVLSLQTNGEYDWLVVAGGLIPYVSQYIDQWDADARVIHVDWQLEWFE